MGQAAQQGLDAALIDEFALGREEGIAQGQR